MGAIILTRMKIIVVLGAVLAVAASAAEPGCSNETRSLSACYNYVYESGSSPSAQCCTGLADVVKTRPECLCEVLNTQGINKTRAQSLPTACSVNTPSATYCHSCKNIYMYIYIYSLTINHPHIKSDRFFAKYQLASVLI